MSDDSEIIGYMTCLWCAGYDLDCSACNGTGLNPQYADEYPERNA